MWCAPSWQQHVIPAILLSSTRQLCSTRDQCPWSWYLSRLGHVNENSRLKVHRLLPQHIASDQKHLTVSQQALSLVASYVTCPDTSGLWKHKHDDIAGRLLDRLQSVLSAAVRLVCDGRKYDYVSPLLRDHRVLQRIKFHLSVLVYRGRNNTAPEYLSRDLQQWLSETTTVIINAQADGFTNRTEDGLWSRFECCSSSGLERTPSSMLYHFRLSRNTS